MLKYLKIKLLHFCCIHPYKMTLVLTLGSQKILTSSNWSYILSPLMLMSVRLVSEVVGQPHLFILAGFLQFLILALADINCIILGEGFNFLHSHFLYLFLGIFITGLLWSFDIKVIRKKILNKLINIKVIAVIIVLFYILVRSLVFFFFLFCFLLYLCDTQDSVPISSL